MNFYKIMRDLNKLMSSCVTELNRGDVEAKLQMNADHETKEILDYLGCTVTYVADIFNVKMPEAKFTRDELAKQKRVETYFNSL